MRKRRPKPKIPGDANVTGGRGEDGDSERDTGEKESGAGREPAE